MARRGALAPIELTFFVDSLARLSGAIALDTLAFVIWNVGTRPPLDLIRDVRRSLREPRALVRGTFVALAGAIAIVGGTALLLPAVPNPSRELALVETFTFVIALALEFALGDDLRALVKRGGNAQL